MGKEFQEQFKYDWAKFLTDNYSTISDEMIDLNNLYCNYETIKQETVTVQDMLRNAIENKNFIRLKWLNESVLAPDIGKKFKPQKHFFKVIKNPLYGLLQEEFTNANTENVDLIKKLAVKFQVELTKPATEEENGDNTNRLEQ